MKRADSPTRRFLVATLLLGFLTLILPSAANAVPVGSAPCVQNINSTTGVSLYRDGNICFVAFKSVQSYIWTPPTGVNKIDLLVVAGGGGGASRHSGGGGAGGLISSSNISITSSDLTIAVGGGGAGGAAAASGGNSATNGSDSVVSGSGFTTRTAVGGGGGGHGGGTNSGGSGGSGAGGGSGGAGGAATAGQGNIGSAGGTDGANYWVGGGGGGAGAPAGASTSSRGGNGGAGLEITWLNSTIVANIGVGILSGGKYYLAGGGGGGTDRNNFVGGDAGIGGGGAGSTGTGTVYNASVNSGGGGGGSGVSGVSSGSFKGGDGGSGVVVIKYAMPTFTNSATSSIAENSSVSSNAATVTVTESSTVTLVALSDYALFTVVASDSVTVRVRFLASPDFESAADVGRNNEYDLTLRATNSSGNYIDSTLKITVTDVLESATVTAPTLSGGLQKGRPVTITVTSNSPGLVRFFVTGKRIPGCLARATSGSYPNFTATCSWKPPVTGRHNVSAIIIPANGSLSAVSSPVATIQVLKRATTR